MKTFDNYLKMRANEADGSGLQSQQDQTASWIIVQDIIDDASKKIIQRTMNSPNRRDGFDEQVVAHAIHLLQKNLEQGFGIR